MALNREEKKKWLQILEKYPGSPNSDKVYPEDYIDHLNRVERVAVTLEVPAVNVPVTCYINRPKVQKTDLVYINLHGGGWFIKWNEDDKLYSARIADEVGCTVVDVDYATSPDYAYPVALEQVYQVLNWTAEQCRYWNADSGKIVVGGCSAGGNMTAAVCILSEIRESVKPYMQILDCASLDKATPPQLKPGGQNYIMPLEKQQALTELYFDGDRVARFSPTASPVYADDDMISRMPKALIITGGKDCLRFEAEAYGKRLVEHGIEVTMKRFTDSCHGFNVRLMDQWRESQQFIIEHLRAQ